MTKMWELDSITIDEFLKQINASKLALPQFQRNWVWKKADWIPFLTTILRARPAGTLLLLEVDDGAKGFRPMPIKDAPPIGSPGALKWLLLDGQQRLTTAYHAFSVGFVTAQSKTQHIIVNVQDALKRGEINESDLSLRSGASVKSPSLMAQSGLLALPTLIDDAAFTAWQFSYAATFMSGDLDRLFCQLDVVAPGLRSVKNYGFPVLKVTKETPLDVVVDIFEQMNRRGQKLNQFDLMVARLYHEIQPGVYYDLRKAWESALEASENLGLLGVDAGDGMLPLQLIAMQVSRLPVGTRPEALKGLNGRDVLELPAAQVIGQAVLGQAPQIKALNLESAVAALEAAAVFLRNQCGVRSKHLLPQISMLIPLADQFLRSADRRLPNEDLKRWFFSAGLSIRYYGGVNSFAESDCKSLADWAEPNGKQSPVVAGVTKQTVESLNLKEPMTREGQILGATIMALLISAGAKDWSAGSPMLNIEDTVEFHHMVPEQRLKELKLEREQRRPIALLTPIDSGTNKKLGQRNPSDIIKALGGEASGIMLSHHVDAALLSKAYGSIAALEKFIAAREAALKKFVIAALNL